MKHIHTFENFLSEASAFDTRYLKNINFILRAFDKPYSECFQFTFNDKVKQADVEDAIKSEKNAAGVKYEWEGNKLLVTPGKDNAGLTYVFKALDDLYGQYGESMGWC